MSGSIQVRTLGKRFNRDRSRHTPTLKGLMLGGFGKGSTTEILWALRDVNFEVESGKALGVVGHNGSGKSTLLRLLGGVMKADEGQVVTAGPISGLLELNTAMHPELSGRENVMIGGVVSGLSLRDVRSRFDEIVSFAELEDFIDSPVRTYSAGMKLRLGFAVATHARPGILLIDEVLAVGDLEFQAKCLDRIRQFKEQGAAIVFASHDLEQVKAMCDQTLWLNRGVQTDLGEPRLVVGRYRNDAAGRMREHTNPQEADRYTADGTLLKSGHNRFGCYETEMTNMELMIGNEPIRSEVAPGTPLRVRVSYKVKNAVSRPILLVSIGTSEQENLLSMNSAADNVELRGTPGEHRACIDIDRLDLAPGRYFVSAGLFSSDWERPLDFHWQAYPLIVSGAAASEGILWPPRNWSAG